MSENNGCQSEQECRVQPLNALVARLTDLHDNSYLSWREIGKMPEFKNVPFSTLAAIYNGREPKNPETRAKLGLPALVEIPPCQTCGKVHLQKTCPTLRKPRAKRPEISQLESGFLYFLRIHGFDEPPFVHYRFHPTRRWEFDFAWPETMIAVEMEGGVFTKGGHVRGLHYTSDCEKYNEAQLLGWKVYRFTIKMLETGVAEQQIYKIFAPAD